MKSGKAAGFDRISVEMLRAGLMDKLHNNVIKEPRGEEKEVSVTHSHLPRQTYHDEIEYILKIGQVKGSPNRRASTNG